MKSHVPGARVYQYPRDIPASEFGDLSVARQLEIGAASIDYKWHWNNAGYKPYGNDCPFCNHTGKCHKCKGLAVDAFGNECQDCDEGVCFHCKGELHIIHEKQVEFHDGIYSYRAFISGVGVGKCLRYDTDIWMADGTLRQIQDIQPGDRVVTYAGDESTTATVNDVIDVGEKQEYVVTLYGGHTVSVSEDHPFLAIRSLTRRVNKERPGADKRESVPDSIEWTKLDELQSGDYVAVPRTVAREPQDDLYCLEQYELLGYLLGDGGLTLKDQVRFSAENDDVVAHVESLLGSTNVLNPIGGCDYRIVGTTHGNNDMLNWLRKHNLQGTGSYTKFVPEFVYQSSDAAIAATLSGLLVTDGWVDGRYLGFACVSKELSAGVERMFRLLGMVPITSTSRKTYKGREFNVYNVLVGRKEDLLIAVEKLNLLHKHNKLVELCNSKSAWSMKGINKHHYVGDLEFIRIKSIEKGERVQMYDLSIEGTHNFVGNGICVHNTAAGTAEAVKQAIDQPGSTGIICAPTYKQLKSSTLPHFFKMLHPDSIAAKNMQDGGITLTNGTTIWLRSTESPEAIEGIDAAWFLYDEGSKGTEKAWNILEERLRKPGYTHKGWVSTTPYGRNWLWERFADPNRPETYENTYHMYNAIIDDNPYLSKSYITRLKASRHGRWAEQQLYGKFVGFDGLVYPMFDPETHVITSDEIPKDWNQTFYLHDWGFTHPMVVLTALTDWDGRVYIVDEWYQTRRTITDVVRVRQDFLQKWGEGQGLGDPSGADNIEELNRNGLPTEGAYNDINYGVQKVTERLMVQQDEKPRLFVHERCEQTIREFMVYKYPEDKDGRIKKDKPEDDNNHSMDAVRYLCLQLDGGHGGFGLMDSPDLQEMFFGGRNV